MQLLNFDPKDDAATIRFSSTELRHIASILSGVLNTFPDQDATILGIDEARLDRLNTDIHAIAQQIGDIKVGR